MAVPLAFTRSLLQMGISRTLWRLLGTFWCRSEKIHADDDPPPSERCIVASSSPTPLQEVTPVDIAHTLDDSAHSIPPHRPALMFALIIGINKYERAGLGGFQNLRGCVADADDVARYLTESRDVAPERIMNLRDEEATRAGILHSIRAIIDSPDVLPNDPILIFWAGHGSRGRSSRQRVLSRIVGGRALESSPSTTLDDHDQYVEMLIPYDFEPSRVDLHAQGIPDYLFGSLLSELSRAKGDNITVILDTCHAASSTRYIGDSRVRGFELLADDSIVDRDRDIALIDARYRDMSPRYALGWASPDLSSHVVLAATSSSRPAREHDGRGVFTHALLEFLRNHEQPDRLTYSDVIHSLPSLGEEQRPQCEGKNAGRYLFTTDAPTRGYHRYHHRDGQAILEAGHIHGVVRDSLFDLYTSPDSSQEPVIRGLIATHPGATQTRLQASPHHHFLGRVPSTGWAMQRRVDMLVDVTSASITSVRNARSGELLSFSRAHDELVSNHQDASFSLALVYNLKRELIVTRTSEGHIVLDVEDDICHTAGLQRLRSPESPHVELSCRPEMLYAAADFFHHLRRTNKQHPLRGSIKVEANLLGSRGGRPVPVGDNLLSDCGSLSPEYVYEDGEPGIHQCYGLTFVNNYHQPLYFWIFGFNMNDLSIDEVYRPAQASDPGAADPCTLPGGALTIGYGSGGVPPQAFFVPPNEDVAVTYLKVFVSLTRVDLSQIPQSSCFSSERRMMINRGESTLGPAWDTLELPTIARRKERN